MRNTSWLLLGAAGFTGQMIAEQAVQQGQRPVLAGRSEANLRPLAEQLHLDYRVVDVTQPAQVRDALHGMGGVLHAAGQYTRTAPVVVDACLAEGTAYADIANEVWAVRFLQSKHAEALARGIPLISGVGYGVVATNCLARYVVDRLPDASTLECAFTIDAAQGAPGAAATGLDLLRYGGWVVRNGKFVRYRLGKGAKRVAFADGEQLVSPTPVGDLASAFQATGVPNVTLYTPLLPTGAAGLLLPMVRRAILVGALRKLPAPPMRAVDQQSAQRNFRSQAWARATNTRAQSAEAWLEMGDGNVFAAVASVLAMRRLLEQDVAGALTPVQAFGPDFALSVPGTRRFDALPADQRARSD